MKIRIMLGLLAFAGVIAAAYYWPIMAAWAGLAFLIGLLTGGHLAQAAVGALARDAMERVQREHAAELRRANPPRMMTDTPNV